MHAKHHDKEGEATKVIFSFLWSKEQKGINIFYPYFVFNTFFLKSMKEK